MRTALALVALMPLGLPLPAGAADPCAVCSSSAATTTPLTIEIISDLEFSRMALTGREAGRAQIDPQTGSRQVDGGLVGLGGFVIKGRARITGAPLRPVRIDLPPEITMTSAGGGKAQLTDFTTDLPAFPVLDSGGRLEFSFGGVLKVSGAAGGNFRARIPISVDYN